MRKQILASALAAMMMVGAAVPSFATSVTASGTRSAHKATGIASATDTMDTLSVDMAITGENNFMDSDGTSDSGVARVQKVYTNNRQTLTRMKVNAVGYLKGQRYTHNATRNVL